MKYLSVCSGIEAATVAWHHMGWTPVAFSEIEKFPSAVLAHHYPNVPNLGDMTKYKDWNLNESINILVGGTPCQSFSVAGLRKGLEDPRGNLALTYVGLLDKFRPKWFIWENVPGVLSSNGGRDFGSFLGAVAELGYGWAYRVLDAQYFGVAQRRRRVFVVGCLGDWESAAEVLFESDCLRRDTTKGRKTGKETSTSFVPSLANCLQTTSNDYSRADGFNMIAYESHPADSRIKEMGETCQTVTSRWGTGGGNVPLVQAFDSYNLSLSDTNQTIKSPQGGTLESVGGVIAFEPGIAKREGGNSRFTEEMSPTLRKEMGDNQVAVAYSLREDAKANTFSATELEVSNAIGALRPSPQSHHAQVFVAHTFKVRGGCEGGGKGYLGQDEKAFTISTTQDQQLYANMAVRRLTPMECERLQGFPDNYTDIKLKGKDTPDGPRYKALGNSMAVPCMKWIGEGIDMIENP
jgi:DNA (cytosine-5)-methyltransferase 1